MSAVRVPQQLFAETAGRSANRRRGMSSRAIAVPAIRQMNATARLLRRGLASFDKWSSGQCAQKRDQLCDFLRRKIERSQQRVKMLVRPRSSVIEFHDLFQIRQAAIVHVGSG